VAVVSPASPCVDPGAEQVDDYEWRQPKSNNRSGVGSLVRPMDSLSDSPSSCEGVRSKGAMAATPVSVTRVEVSACGLMGRLGFGLEGSLQAIDRWSARPERSSAVASPPARPEFSPALERSPSPSSTSSPSLPQGDSPEPSERARRPSHRQASADDEEVLRRSAVFRECCAAPQGMSSQQQDTQQGQEERREELHEEQACEPQRRLRCGEAVAKADAELF